MRRTLTALLVTAALAAACSPQDDGPPADASTTDHAPVTNRVSIPATVRRHLGITFAEVEARQVGTTMRVPGAFELQPLARHEYRMVLSGRVELLVDQYEPVEPGTPIYRYRSPEWPKLRHDIVQSEQAIDTTRAELDVAKARAEEARRKLSLLKARLEALEQAEFRRADLIADAADLEATLPRLDAEVRLAETRLSSAERGHEHALHAAAAATTMAEPDLARTVTHDGVEMPAYRMVDWIEIRATEPGIVEALHITDGAFVESPATVLSTVNPELLRFRATALQADLPQLQRAAKASIVPPESPGIPLGDACDASFSLGLEAHPEERTITVIAVPEKLSSWMRPGVSAFLEVVTDESGTALAIPLSAVVQDGIRHVFFRRDPKNANEAIRVEADLGVSDGRWVVVESGVMKGDEVVLEGAYELKLATQQSGAAQKGGHFHADGTFHQGED